MAHFHVIAGGSETPEFPIVRRIGPADLKDALRKGFADFWAMPSQVFFLGLIYPIAGVILAGFSFGQNMLPLLYPLASGFALVGPIVSIGLYELSRRREQGLPTDWKYAFEVLQSPAIGSIAALGVVLLVIFISWLLAAQALYQGLYGYRPVGSLPTFLYEALTTSRGWTLIILGNLIGFVFAAVVLAISVISFPLLLDRDVGAAIAVQTSVRAVLTNPVTTALWGLIVAGLLALGFATLLVGHLPWGVPYWAASDGEVPHVTASERSAAPLERRREECARTTEPIAECTGSPGCPCPSLTGCG